MAVALVDWAWVIDVEQELAHLLVLGDEEGLNERLTWWQAQHSNPVADTFKLLSAWQASKSQSEYEACFNQVQDYLNAGDCYQINLTLRFNANFSGDTWQAYRRLSAQTKRRFPLLCNYLTALF